MSNQAFCKSSSLKRLSLVALAACGVLAESSALAERPNDSIYIGASYGLQVRNRCETAVVCNRGGDVAKLTLGYHVSPSWGYELNYFALGAQKRSWNSGPVTHESVRTHALGVGFTLDTELFGIATNHLRAGLANASNTVRQDLANGTRESETKGAIAPYAGVGMSFLVAPHFRLQTGVDVIFNKSRNNYLATVGAMTEF